MKEPLKTAIIGIAIGMGLILLAWVVGLLNKATS